MNKRDKSRDEENEYPRKAGNMTVLARCPTRGYELECACRNTFKYIPLGVNTVKVDGSTRAMCPSCNMVWNENLKCGPLQGQKYLALYLVLPGSDEPILSSLVVGFSKVAMINQLLVKFHLEHDIIDTFIIKSLTRERFDYEEAKLREKNSAFVSDKMSEMFKGIFGDVFKEPNG